MSDKTLADLNVDIKEIQLTRIFDRTTDEIIEEFDPPIVLWKEGDPAFEPYEKVPVRGITEIEIKVFAAPTVLFDYSYIHTSLLAKKQNISI